MMGIKKINPKVVMFRPSSREVHICQMVLCLLIMKSAFVFFENITITLKYDSNLPVNPGAVVPPAASGTFPIITGSGLHLTQTPTAGYSSGPTTWLLLVAWSLLVYQLVSPSVSTAFSYVFYYFPTRYNLLVNTGSYWMFSLVSTGLSTEVSWVLLVM